MELTAKEFIKGLGLKNRQKMDCKSKIFPKCIEYLDDLLEEYHQAKMKEHKKKLLNEAKKIPMATGGWIAKRLGYRS